MARIKHLEILKKGVDVWNKWRENDPDVTPDLSGASISGRHFGMDLNGVELSGIGVNGVELKGLSLGGLDLSRTNLTGVNFTEARFSEVDLSWADLRRVNLNRVNLNEVNFRGADLSRAFLWETNFIRVNLHGAKLRGAFLRSTVFDDANLTKCDFKNSYFYRTKILNCDLSQSKGLSYIEHSGRSTVDIYTIFRSKGKIPISFLRGCGIPDDVFKNVLDLAKERAFGFHSCFISYSAKDEIFAEELKKDLEANNVSCWFFPEHAVWGKDIEENIDRAIREYDKLIVVCSEDSLNSEPVLREIERALQKEQSTKEKHKKTKRILFPVVIDDYFFNKWDHHLKPLMLRIVYGKFKDHKNSTEYKKALNKLLEGLKKE